MEGLCEFCGEVVDRPGHRFCSRSCAARMHRGLSAVDRNYDWKKLGRDTWQCRYQEFASCRNRNCEACGWNPAVAKARTERFLARRKGAMA